MNIQEHPAWGNIQPHKKPGHLLRLFLARKISGVSPRSRFIGITGSVGKTTTKEFCYAVLSQKFKTIASRENIDPIFNIPETLLKVRPNTEKVILEMGIEYPEEMDFYLSLVQPATAIITRISYAHSLYLGNVEQIAIEKGKLVKQLPKDGVAILNWDDISCRKLASETEAKVLFYGINSKNCHVSAGNIKIIPYYTRFELNYGVERVEVNLKLLGRHWVSLALAAATLGLANGLSLFTIKKGLEEVLPQNHRLQILEGQNGSFILDDTYNSSPVALEEALNVLAEIPARKRIAVLGEMRELGGYSEQLHRDVARRIYKDRCADVILLGGGDACYIADELTKLGFSGKVESNLSHSQIVAAVLRTVNKGDVVLVKGSRAVKLEEVVGRIKKQK